MHFGQWSAAVGTCSSRASPSTQFPIIGSVTKKTVSPDRSKEEMGKLQHDIYKASVDLPVDKSSRVFGPPRTYRAAETPLRRRTRRRTVLSRLTRVRIATRQSCSATRHGHPHRETGWNQPSRKWRFLRLRGYNTAGLSLASAGREISRQTRRGTDQSPRLTRTTRLG